MKTWEQLQETVCDRLFWHTAEGDGSKVAKHLFHRLEMDMAYAIDEVTPRRDSVHSSTIFKKLKPSFFRTSWSTKTMRKKYSVHPTGACFFMKVVGSIKTMEEVSDLLLTYELLMSMCSFKAYQVKNGNCKRGVKLRKHPLLKSETLCV